MFKKDELAASPQDAPKTPDGLGHIGNCAQREGADNCIDGAVPQGNMFDAFCLKRTDAHHLVTTSLKFVWHSMAPFRAKLPRSR